MNCNKEANLYDDPCPDCEGEGEMFDVSPPRTWVCPSCDGSGTRPTVTDAEYAAAWTEWCESGNFRSALEAAARAREENRDG